jgi:23S rRNA (adenine2503-C2)-methyltransferase
MRPHLLSLLPEEIAAHLRANSVLVRDDEARRALVHAASSTGLLEASRRPLSRSLLRDIDEKFDTRRPEIIERVDDPLDGFVKYLFRAADGALFEAVRIPLHKPERYSICLSSQVGCAMKCDFCATGRLGLTRNLAAGEIVGSFLSVRDDIDAGGRATGAVFMGQGEPFHNFDQVIRAARVLSHPCGGRVAADAITISTVGLVPQIRRFTREDHPYRLIVSLSSAVAERRAMLLPVVAGRWTVEETVSAIREHERATGAVVTVAWVTLGGVNTGDDEVEALERLLRGTKVRVNLIDVNDARTGGYQRAADAERDTFRDRLRARGISTIRRYSGGAARHAACGMLANVRSTPLAAGSDPE